MSFYQPKTEEQLIREGLLSDAIYDVEVAETLDRPSKAGNPMITLKMNVFAENGDLKTVVDYISLGNNFGERKLRHAASAFGLIEAYNAGTLKAEDFQNQCGKAEIKQQKGNTDYPNPKNVVTDYIGRDENAAAPVIKTKEKPPQDMDDGVPF